jgi:hypothetical protein
MASATSQADVIKRLEALGGLLLTTAEDAMEGYIQGTMTLEHARTFASTVIAMEKAVVLTRALYGLDGGQK